MSARELPARWPSGSLSGPTRPCRAEAAPMHPAYSVIVFTTASGAGYGLLIWLALGAVFNLVPRDPVLGFFGLGIALALITAGLLTSALHLGRPKRAWRALSQWKTSWLS